MNHNSILKHTSSVCLFQPHARISACPRPYILPCMRHIPSSSFFLSTAPPLRATWNPWYEPRQISSGNPGTTFFPLYASSLSSRGRSFNFDVSIALYGSRSSLHDGDSIKNGILLVPTDRDRISILGPDRFPASERRSRRNPLHTVQCTFYWPSHTCRETSNAVLR